MGMFAHIVSHKLECDCLPQEREAIGQGGVVAG